jgi:hypothetical protein
MTGTVIRVAVVVVGLSSVSKLRVSMGIGCI